MKKKFEFVKKIDYKEEALEELSKIHQELDPLCGDSDCCGICNE